MGAWSAEPFGNDVAADWAWDLDDAADWDGVAQALAAAAVTDAESDEVDDMIALAAAEVVAHGLGRPTQSDVYTESVEAFVGRVEPPEPALRGLALAAVEAAGAPDSALGRLWDGDPEWAGATAALRDALRDPVN